MRYFDITRLSRRATAHGPSGIERVDLAYHEWLKTNGPVGYLTCGSSGFSEIDAQQGRAFLEKLNAKWKGGSIRFDRAELRRFRDSAQPIRMLGKFFLSRAGLKSLQLNRDLHHICQNKNLDLDLIDPAAPVGTYRVDPSWRNHDKTGCAFLISHSTLTKTAYLAALAKHEHLKRVFFIHDTIPCDHPEFCRALGGLKHLLRIRNTFRYATHVVVNSEYTKTRLEHWRKRLEEKELPVKVIPIGVDDGLLEHARHDVRPTVSNRPYFVILGTIEPRKNHGMLLDVWLNFVKTLPPERIPELLIIGRRGWKNKSVFRMLDRCEPLRGHVREMNSVSDAELWPLLRGARAMLFPSFVEGWGMPLIEALTLGVPVIGSEIDAFKEAGQGVPELLPVSDSNLWAARIMDYSNDESEGRREQLERIGNFSPPTWKGHFESLEDMLACDS